MHYSVRCGHRGLRPMPIVARLCLCLSFNHCSPLNFSAPNTRCLGLTGVRVTWVFGFRETVVGKWTFSCSPIYVLKLKLDVLIPLVFQSVLLIFQAFIWTPFFVVASLPTSKSWKIAYPELVNCSSGNSKKHWRLLFAIDSKQRVRKLFDYALHKFVIDIDISLLEELQWCACLTSWLTVSNTVAYVTCNTAVFVTLYISSDVCCVGVQATAADHNHAHHQSYSACRLLIHPHHHHHHQSLSLSLLILSHHRLASFAADNVSLASSPSPLHIPLSQSNIRLLILTVTANMMVANKIWREVKHEWWR